MTIPFAGHPTGASEPEKALNEADKIESAYRFLLGDLMPFGKNAVIQLEHGGLDESVEHYRTVAYWYGIPAASLIETDTFQVGDDASEKAHEYLSPDASPPYSITSRATNGASIRSVARSSIPPPPTRAARRQAPPEFTVKIDPRNLGVMLRRKLVIPFRTNAEVFVADVGNAGTAEVATGEGLVPGWIKYLRALGAGKNWGGRTQHRRLQPPVPRRRIFAAQGFDRGPVGHPGSG